MVEVPVFWEKKKQTKSHRSMSLNECSPCPCVRAPVYARRWRPESAYPALHLSFKKDLDIFILFMSVLSACVLFVCMCVSTTLHMWNSEDNFGNQFSPAKDQPQLGEGF